MKAWPAPPPPSWVFGEGKLCPVPGQLFRYIENSEGELVDGTPAVVEIVDGTFVDLAGLPAWQGPDKPARTHRDNSFKNTAPADRAEVELALSVITDDDYPTWLSVGAALFNDVTTRFRPV